jgi:hypothetical protein
MYKVTKIKFDDENNSLGMSVIGYFEDSFTAYIMAKAYAIFDETITYIVKDGMSLGSMIYDFDNDNANYFANKFPTTEIEEYYEMANI